MASFFLRLKNGAPHGGSNEVLRLHSPQTCSLEDGAPTVALVEATSKAHWEPDSAVLNDQHRGCVGLIIATANDAERPAPEMNRVPRAPVGNGCTQRRRVREAWSLSPAPQLRHECLAAGVSTFELSRLMGCSVAMIDRTYGHLACDSEAAILARLNARAATESKEEAQ